MFFIVVTCFLLNGLLSLIIKMMVIMMMMVVMCNGSISMKLLKRTEESKGQNLKIFLDTKHRLKKVTWLFPSMISFSLFSAVRSCTAVRGSWLLRGVSDFLLPSEIKRLDKKTNKHPHGARINKTPEEDLAASSYMLYFRVILTL